MVVGCDPKTDCARNLRGCVEAKPLLDFLRGRWCFELDLTEILDWQARNRRRPRKGERYSSRIPGRLYALK